jgi:hypothetical protein
MIILNPVLLKMIKVFSHSLLIRSQTKCIRKSLRNKSLNKKGQIYVRFKLTVARISSTTRHFNTKLMHSTSLEHQPSRNKSISPKLLARSARHLASTTRVLKASNYSKQELDLIVKLEDV